jgi:hypothetical protein
MDILIITETFDVLKNFILQLELKENLDKDYARFTYKNERIDILISGYGGSINMYSVTKAITQNKYDLVLHFGQCYSLKDNIVKDQLVCLIDDYFGDVGWQFDNSFKSVFDLSQRNKDEYPFEDEILENNISTPDIFSQIRKVSGITCNIIPDNIQNISNAYLKNYPDVISREGANILFICQKEDVKLIQLFYVLERIENSFEAINPTEKMIIAIQTLLETLSEESFAILSESGIV